MAAFQFPDPTVQQTVTNPITGSTYQWKEPPGKWVITTKVRAVTDIIHEGDTPPVPRGDYKLWYSTDTLELYFWYEDVNGVGAWVPTSAPITMLEDLDEGLFEVRQLLNQVNAAAITNENEITLIQESLGKVNLQEVLDNGNVADKDIYLTHLAHSNSDVIDISPEKAKLVIATEGSKVPTFELQHYAVDDNSQVKLELDEDGRRFDIECDEKVDNIQFRFEEDVKFELNKDGGAVFTGKVKVQPGETDNEVVTYNQLTLLEEQIEEIAPSLEHGKWEFTFDYPPQVGQYTMIKEVLDEDTQEEQCAQTLAECQLANQGNPTELGNCSRDFDACMNSISGTKFVTTQHWFSSTRIVFSDVDKNGTVHRWNDIKPGEYIEVFNVDGSGGMVSEITKKNYKGDISHTPDKGIGEAHDLAAVKIYNLPDANPADFVHSSGDEMTGALSIKPTSESTNLYLRGSDENADGKNIIDVYSNKGHEIFWVDSTHVGVNNSAKTPTSSSHLTSKKYVDDTFVSKTGDTMTGALIVEPTAGNTTLKIQGSSTSSDNQNILNVYSNKGSQVFWVDSKHAGLTGSAKTPTNDSHLVTKKYVDDRRGYGVPYKYRFTDQKAENLQVGEFFIANNNSIYCARYNAESKDMATSGSYVTDQNRFGLLKIYAANGNLLHMIEYKELRIGQGSNSYVRWLYTSKLKSYSSWMESETYYLADGLLLPY